MSTFDFPDLPSQFRQLLGKCRDLYVSSGELAARDNPQQLETTSGPFVQLMDDLHGALLVKVFVSVCQCDRRWSKNEKFLAEVLVFHLWDRDSGSKSAGVDCITDFKIGEDKIDLSSLLGWRDLAWGGKTPIAAFEDQARQNMALFEQALKMDMKTPLDLLYLARIFFAD